MPCALPGNSDNPNTWENVKGLVDELGSDDADPINDEYETSTAGGNNAGGVLGIQAPGAVQTSPPGAITDKPEESNTSEPPSRTPVSVNCTPFLVTNPIDYSFKLSKNFTLGQLTKQCVFSHSIVAQHGLSIPELVCNLQTLCQTVLEKVWLVYPGMRINSAFRQGDGKSQHERGQAADVQWPGISENEYWNRAAYIKENIVFDQFIYEYGNSVWLHLSYNPGAAPRRKVLTMYRNKYSPGLLKMR
jgi:hypothetical protein